jgi:miniconductance mechanosensitive channel
LEQLAQVHPLLPELVMVVGLLLAATVGYWLSNRFLVGAVRTFARRTTHTWDDALIEFRVFARFAQLVPAYIIYLGIDLLPGLGEMLTSQVLNLTSAYMIVVLTLTVTAVLSAANAIYEARPESKQRPIKGFVQLVQLIVLILGFLLFISALLDQSPVLLLSGFGAMTAVLLLVFKDTILSLVASVQLSAQDMVRVGDWIEVPQFGADGDVVDVELHTIKVQNWDKTITTIPTHRLISDSFKNWRGMSNAGGRRIKRALYLDANSIRFLRETEVARYKRFALLSDYVDAKQSDLDAYNQALQGEYLEEASANVNLRRLTNVGTFRAYAYNYLSHHPNIRKDMTLLVRQLPSGPQGLPIELYCFTNTTEWNDYEDIQADIFDHLMAIVPEFGLRLYQQPAGSDLAALADRVT